MSFCLRTLSVCVVYLKYGVMAKPHVFALGFNMVGGQSDLITARLLCKAVFPVCGCYDGNGPWRDDVLIKCDIR